jgi:hypothetical protein
MSKTVELVRREQTDLQKQMFNCNTEKLDKAVFEQYIIHTSKQFKALSDDIATTNKELLATDNYLEKYLPFKILNYIYDSSQAFLNPRQVAGLNIYMDETYKHLEYVVQNDDGKPRYAKKDY